MTPYKGIIRISCNKKASGCDKKLLRPEASCINCNRGKVEILDLEGKVIAERKAQTAKIVGRATVPAKKVNNK